MRKVWSEEAWEDYLYWQTQDKKTLKRINQLIKDIERNGYNSIGKLEPLKADLSGYWSVRIDFGLSFFFLPRHSKYLILKE